VANLEIALGKNLNNHGFFATTEKKRKGCKK